MKELVGGPIQKPDKDGIQFICPYYPPFSSESLRFEDDFHMICESMVLIHRAEQLPIGTRALYFLAFAQVCQQVASSEFFKLY
ncbi:unnamed protein product [Protopolystoma xenopodis]|uniref:Uncharacterized protein n=1 Tax=Protopolystoma xenopodis TaxID=117903 RepID=A0A448WX94_9PLAT|nr:unnamed protein product [Protopolystoma xenopodis]